MNAIDKLVKNAKSQIGYIADKNKKNKYAQYLDSLGNIYNGKKNGYDWCDVFVDYIFISTFGVEIGMNLLCQAYYGLGAGCKYSAQYYKNKGQFFHTPKIGDQIFFGTSSSVYHTGIVIDIDNKYVYTVEGNANNRVQSLRYSLNSSSIYGYGRPDYSIVKEVDEMRYKRIEDCPEWCRDYLRTLINKGYLNDIDLTLDMIRCLVVAGRIGGLFK